MASNNSNSESLGELYARIGLDFDELNNSFVQVERTLSQNIARLNSERNSIKIQSEIEMLGLDKVADATAIFEVKQRQLQKQIETYEQQLKILSANLEDTRKKTGANSLETQRAAEKYDKARLAVGKLRIKLREMTQEQQKATNASAVNYKKLFESIGLRTNLTENFGLSAKLGDLKEAFPALEGGINKVVKAFEKIPTPAKYAAAAIAAISVAVKAAENGLMKLAEPAITAGDGFYVASRGAQMTIAEFGKLSNICKVTGIELDEVLNVMKRINMQLVRNEDGNLAQIFQKYGIEARNANGELKNALDLSLEIAAGFEHAKAQNEGKDFIAGVFGRQASGDIVTYIEDLKGNVELAKEIVGNGLFDPARAHSVQGEINALNTQAGKLESAFSAAFIPAAEKLVPNLRDRVKELTTVINENAEGIKNLGENAATVIDTLATMTTKAVKFGVKVAGTIGDIYSNDKFIKEYGEMTDKIKSADDLIKAEFTKMLPMQRFSLEGNAAEFERFYNNMNYEFRKIQKWRTEKQEQDKKDLKNQEEQQTKQRKLNDEELKQLKDYNKELEKLKLEATFGKNESFGKSLAELEQWQNEELEKAKDAEELKTKVKEIAAFKRLEIEKTLAEKIKDITTETADIEFEKMHSSFEKQLRDIEKWKKAQLEKADTAREVTAIIANAAQKETRAIENEIDRIRGKTQTLAEKIFEKTHSQRDIDIKNAQKEYMEYWKEGIYPKEMIDLNYRLSIGDIFSNRDKKYFEQPNFQTALPDIDFYTPLKSAVDNLVDNYKPFILPIDLKAEFDTKTPNFENLKSEMQEVQVDVKAKLQDLETTLQPVKLSFGDFDKKLLTAANSVTNFSNVITTAADKISEFEIAPHSSASKDRENFSPKFNLPKSEKNFTPTKEMNEITRRIIELTNITGTIANEISQKKSAQKPQIIVNLSPQINLGGAYVFDNAMKSQLTNDITTEVANAVEDAVTQATKLPLI